MSISKYRAFVSAAEQGSMTRAAEQLGYTQSGVSHLIQALEGELGVPLLVRARTGLLLTTEGTALLPYIKQVLVAEQDVISKATHLRGLTAGILRIGTFSSVAIHWLPKILAEFRQHYPGVEIQLINGNYVAVEEAVLKNAVDCGFVILPSLPDFTADTLAHDRLLAVVAEKSHLGKRNSLHPRDLLGETLILPAEGVNYSIGKLFSQVGALPRRQLAINDDYAAVEMVRLGLGVTILPELMARDLPTAKLRLIPLQNSEREIGIAVLKSRCLSPAIHAFLTCVRNCLGRERPF